MKVRALRGVCIGVERHLKAGDTVDLPPAEVPFLVSIKAVEIVKDLPPPTKAAAASVNEQTFSPTNPTTSTEPNTATEPTESNDVPARNRRR